MTKFIYFRLARNNLVKNRQAYLPFLLASTLLTFTMYSFLMIAFNPGFGQVHGGMEFVIILDFGIAVVGLFTAIFLFYANSFLIKRRKKEMGLYAILGMEKKHISRVLFHELSIAWLISTVAGLGLGLLLTRLMFLLIRLAIRMDVPLSSSVNFVALIATVVLFGALYLLLDGYNAWQVRSVNPIELMRGGRTGEREPKARWILAVLGVGCTGAGYWIAQTVNSPMSAIALFFIAVILVIFGTYLLFLSGSIALLKLMKRNKRFYYRSKHFVTVSGLLYRMKQNAAGLASIAILCTMAMITIGTTVALYNGTEKVLSSYYPSDVQLSVEDTASLSGVEAQNAAIAQRCGVTVEQYFAFSAYETEGYLTDGKITGTSQRTDITNYNDLHGIMLLSQAEYTALEGATLTLAPDEIGYYGGVQTLPSTMTIGSELYRLQKIDHLAVIPSFSNNYSVNNLYLVVPNDSVALAMLSATGESDSKAAYTAQWNVRGSQAQLDDYYAQLKGNDWGEYSMSLKAEMRGEWYALYGGFLFVGIFLGSVFLMGTAIILYFKQISEGYQDHDRFVIMQQVGMSPEEVKGTVRRQILLVFFLPLLVAVCHVAGSLHMMILMLQLFGLMDVPYIAFNTFLSALGVAVLYGLFYVKTTGTYYKMVRFQA